MHMILHTVEQNRLAADALQNTRHVGMKPVPEFDIAKERRSVLRAEDHMKDDAGEGLRHGATVSVADQCASSSVCPRRSDGAARGALCRPVRAGRVAAYRTQGGARASLALGWLVDGPLGR